MDLSRTLMYLVILVTRRLSAENDECLRSKQFESTGKGFALTGYIISSLQVTDLFECSFACLQESRCQSYNFHHIPSPLHLCQLSFERRDTKPGNYQPQADVTYYDANKPQTGPGCSSLPCLNGGKCISTCHNVPFSFRCVCEEPYRGDLCENLKDVYDLTFQTKSVLNYVNSTMLKHTLTAFTLCIWFQTSQVGSFGLVAGLVAIVCHDARICDLYVKDEKRNIYGAPLNDGNWHSLCVTWASVGGNWSAYIDGKTNVRRGGNSFRQNHVVKFNGEQLVLGQKVQGGAFQENCAFAGNISRVNMWDYVLSKDDVHRVATNCSNTAGNALKWRHFRNGLKGSVILSERSQCIGADFSFNVSLKFPAANTVDRVRYSKTLPTLQAFTVCHWTKITAMASFSTTLSYANSLEYNALFIALRADAGVSININNKNRKVISTPFIDKHWHHVCITWTNNGGEIKAVVDGVIKRADAGFQNGTVIKGGGVLIFGQEQDTLGGGFDQSQSFVGLMSHLNMWNFVLHPFCLVDMATGVGTEKGNVVAWGELVRSQMYGAVKVVPVTEDPPKRTMPDFKFIFPSQSVDNYVELKNAANGPNIRYVTACVWVKVAQPSPMVLFSYKTTLNLNTLTIVAKETDITCVVRGNWETIPFNGFMSQSGWQHVCFVWGNGYGNWKLFVNGVIVKSGTGMAVGMEIPGGGKLLLGLRHHDPNTYKSDQCFKGEISHLNIWNKRLDQNSLVIPAMYRGCDAIGGNWLNWAAVSQATVAGNVTIATPAECILPDEAATQKRHKFCKDERMEGCTAPVYALFDGEPNSRSKKWRCYFSNAVKLNSNDQQVYYTEKKSNCFIVISHNGIFDII